MPPQKPRWMLWLQKSWQNKALWKNTQDPLPTARQGIFLLNHVEEFDILKSRSLWMERNIMFVKIKADIRHWLRELDKCSATSFLRNWDSILEKKRANLRSISEPARLRQPPPRSTGAAHARGRAQSIREERRIAAPPVLFALLWVRLLPALYGPFCGPLRPFGGCPWGVTPPARECLPPAPPDTRRRG